MSTYTGIIFIFSDINIEIVSFGTYKIKAYAYIESTNDGNQYALYIPSPVAESDEFEIKAVDTPQIPIDDLEAAAKYANVVINCATEDAEIIYTTENINFPQDIQFDSDGNIVYVDTDGNTLKYQKYDGAFEINNSKQIKFIAYKKGYIPSSPDSEYISVCDKIVYTPYIETEKVFGGIKVSLYSETNGYDENNQINENAVDGLQIYYTTDGTDPLTEGIPYYSNLNEPKPFIVSKDANINAIAVYTKTDNSNSELGVEEIWKSAPCESYTINVPILNKPVIQVDDYDDYSRVTITAHSAADIYYIKGEEFLNFEPIIDDDGIFKVSINESAIKSQTAGTVSFILTDSTTIKAIAVRKGYAVSEATTPYEVLVSKTTPPSVTTLAAENISENSAVLSGEITYSGGYDMEFDEVYNRKFQIFEVGKSNQMYTLNVPTSDSSEFSITADILRPNTKYQYRASAENDKGFSEGEWISFTTIGTASKYPESVEIEPSFLSMTVGTKRTVLVKVLPENAENRNLAWISSNPEVALVNKNGQITAISKGETTIKAISANRIEGSLKLSVVDSEINGEFDFSEINMAKNIGSWNTDSELGYALDTIQVGGNSMMATAYLSRWSGPIKEESDPYPSSIGDISTTQLYSDYHVQEVLFLPPRKDSLDNDDIKRAIMKYGAVYTQFYNDRNYKEGNNIYIPEEDFSTHKNPHAVAIIGWDDNYDYENFSRDDTLDGRNGAFICKNSNGSKDEYLYISYYDKYIARGNENAVFNNLETNTNYNTIYQYDPLGPTLPKEFETTIYMANAFPREGETLKQQEELKAVSFYTGDKGISYEIYAITDFGSNNNFDVGSGLGECLARGIMDYAGYHTVQLDKSVDLMAGTRFAVIVKLSSSNGNVMTYVEAPFGYAINAFAKKGDSFIKEGNGEWLDYNYEYNSEYSGNASLESCLMKKAQEAAYYNSGNIAGSSGISGTDAAVLVDTSEIETKSLILDKTSLTIAKGNTETLYASTYPENATNKDVVWSSNDTNVVKVDTHGKVYAINTGNAKITATHVKTGLTRVCTIKVTEPLAVTGLENVSEALSCEVGENIIIHYDVMPTNAGNKEILVEIEDESIATSSFSMLIGLKAGETTVTITTVDGGYSKTIPLVVSNNAEQETGIYDLEVKSAEISENSMCAEIYNNADVDIASTIYIAVYNDVTHKLENIISDTICIPAKEKITFNRDISISGNSYVKIFLWDSSQQLKPLAKAYMIDVINSYDISVSDVLTDVDAKTISATVKNSDSELLTDADAYVAVYDSGKLLEVQQCEISSLDVGATKNITATFETTDINDYKIFVWDTTLKPLSLVTE